jgi:glyoxylase-like metal-dependent hydrolase (beta-lactamase superfamily II)
MIRKTAGFLMSIILLTAITTDCTGNSGKENLKIYAVKYGVSEFPEKFIFYREKSQEKLPFCWLFYYIEYNDKKILVDTGFNNEKLVKMFEIRDFADPVSILSENGIKAETITDVIITHAHFDHIGNADKFPEARIIIHKKELESIIKRNGLNDVRKYLKGNAKVITFENSISLYDFFRIQAIGGHTEGSSVVYFRYMNKDYCFTGDETYLFDNIQSLTGSGSVVNHNKNISFLKELNKQV